MTEVTEASDNQGPVSHANASRKGLARNVLTGYLAMALTTLTSFLVTPLLLRTLGKEQFGLWTLLLSVLGYVSLVEAGIYTSISRRVAEYMASQDRKRLRQMLATAFLLYFGLMVAVLLLIGVLTAFVGPLFHLEAADLATARRCLWLLGLYQCVQFLVLPQTAILYGAGRMDLATACSTTATLLLTLANAVSVLLGYGITALAWAFIGSALLNCLLTNRAIMRHIPGVVLRLRYASREMARELLKFGSRNAAISISGALAFGSDALIIGLLLPLGNVAHYALASKLVNIVNLLSIKPVNVLLPTYAHLFAQNEVGRLFRLYTQSISTAMAVCLPFTVSLCLLGDRIIRAWVGDGHEASVAVAFILGIWTLIVLPGHASGILMNATEKNLFLVRLYAVAACANVLLSYLLTKTFGIVGPALGSAITVLIVDFAILPWHVCRLFRFSYRAYWSAAFGSLLAPLCVSLVVGFGLRFAPLPPARWVAGLMLAMVMTGCWGTWLLFGLEPDRRQNYLRSIRSVLKRA